VKLLLIDGHYYVYRSFFTIPNLSNSRGEPTNAILGFTKTVRRMLKDLQPEMGAVFWDEGLPQKRVELQPAYKETRKEMPLPILRLKKSAERFQNFLLLFATTAADILIIRCSGKS